MSNQLQQRLQNFEAPPPPNSWYNIEEGLNTGISSLQERLSPFEAPPPADMWNKITTVLDTATAPEKTITKHIGLRYAAAAIVLAIVALVTIRFATNGSEKTLANETNSKLSHTNNTTVRSDNNNSNNINGAETIKEVEGKGTTAPSEASISTTHTKNLSKRYTVVSNEDGQLIRLSKKAYAVFDCAIKSTTMRARCKEDIETMQAKMANTMTSPTTDFAGLIDMIKTLEENE